MGLRGLNEAVTKTVSKKPPSHVVGLSAQRFGFLRSFAKCAVILLSLNLFGRISAVLALLTASCLPPHHRLCWQLLNVVHHAVQIPLRVDLGAAPVIQPGHPLVMPDVGKHRLHRADALAVQLAASG